MGAQTVVITLLFCDLKGFSAFAEEHGDAAAVEAIERFSALVAAERGERGTIVKALGDGYMLAYPEPAPAVAAGARMIAWAESGEGPQIHASVHTGPAAVRDGDYFGHSVNLAARLLDVAHGGELLATEEVARATSGEFRWRHVGLQAIHGFVDPVDVWRLSGARDAA